MELDEFLRLARYSKLLQETFPGDTIWGELEQAVRDHLRKASQERTYLVTVPSSHAEWEEWCKDDRRHLLSGENVTGTVFYPKPIVMDDSSAVDGSVYSTAEIKAQTRTVIHGDLVSQKNIVWQGEMTRSLVAPEIHIDQSVHQLDIAGSIVCGTLKTTPPGYISGKIAGNLFVNQSLVDGRSSKKMSELTISGGSEIGSIHIPCSLLCGDQTTTKHIQAAGDVKLGAMSKAGVVRARNVVIGARSQVNQIYAEGTVEIAEACSVHDVIAAGNIKIGRGVEITSGIVASLNGEIIADQDWWTEQANYLYKGNLNALLDHKMDIGSNGTARSIILRNLPHAWYWSLEGIHPSWLRELVPVR